MFNAACIVVALSLLVLLASRDIEARRIVNGTAVDIRDHPHQVSLQLRPGTENEEFVGGGTLIADHWVLAAAHSFRSLRVRAAYVGVRVGSSLDYEGGTVIDMVGLSIHPNYSVRNKDNDFALIKLRDPYTIDPIARAISLVDAGEVVPEGTVCTASGWGDTKGTGDYQSLKKIDVPIVSHALCKANYAASNLQITDNMLCAGFAEGMQDACTGDSGGPFVCNGKLTGVISWGKGCAQKNFYGVYAVVANARDWIKEKTGV